LNLGVIEGQPALLPLRRISPSRFARLKVCALQEIWAASGTPSFLPRNPLAILGTVAHQVLEDAGRENGFVATERWTRRIAALNKELHKSWLEKRLVPLERVVPKYEVLKLRTCARAEQVAAVVKKHRSGSHVPGIGFEIWVESKDKCVGGWVDSARQGKTGIELRDFKSGELFEQDDGTERRRLKVGHQVQLKLYAALYFQTYGVWPSTIQIIPLAGAALEVPFTQSECKDLLDEATQTLKSLNASISDQQTVQPETFASPSPQSCRSCGYRPVCSRYQEAIGSRGLGTNGWPKDAVGRVWDINVLSGGRTNLRVSEAGGKEYMFRSLSSLEGRNPALKEIRRGDVVGMFDAQTPTNRLELSEGVSTVLYKLPG
jgi:CRISPR/Cas system-associated exonuclease Cas4 (RecB family)